MVLETQATTMKSRKQQTEEEQQRQRRKVLRMPWAISDVLNIGWAHLTVGPLRIKHWGSGPPPPHDRRLC